MANNIPNEPKPFIEITAGAKKELEDIGKAFEQSRKVAADLKTLGIDIKPLEDMVEMGEKMRAIILKNFT